MPRGVKRKAGLDCSADGVTIYASDGRGGTARFPSWQADAVERAESWLAAHGLSLDGAPLASSGAESGVASSSAPIDVASDAEPLVQHEAMQLASSATSAAIPTGVVLDDAAHAGVVAAEHAGSSTDEGLFRQEDLADDQLAASIGDRAATVRQLGEYWGFIEWLAWGFANQTRILMHFAAHAVDLIGTFGGPAAGARV